jgi:hypothetical protein
MTIRNPINPINNMLKKHSYFVILIILLSIPASIPLLRSDFFYFSDESHIANLFQMVRAFESGQMPPRLAPDMSYGYGYPLFNFYYPLPFYIGSAFFIFTGSLVSAFKLATLITVPLSGIFMYYWLAKHTIPLYSFAGAIIYIYTPYRALDLYVRGALGENFAFVFFPLAALCVYKTAADKDFKSVALLAFAVAGLILSHNLAPLLFLPWLVLYSAVLVINSKEKKEKLKGTVAGIMLGLGISSYWWLPAFIEKKLLVTQTPFAYADHFPFIKQLIFSPWGYGASHPGIYDDMSFQIGIVNLVLILAGLILLFKVRKYSYLLTFIMASIFTVILLMNIRTQFIWEISSISNFVQFPWRLLMITTFLTSSLVMFFPGENTAIKTFLIILASFSIILTIGYFRPSEYHNYKDDYFLNRFFANTRLAGETEYESQDYKNYSEDYLLLPIWTKARPSALPEAKITSETAAVFNIQKISAVHYTGDLQAAEEAQVNINFYYFPGWVVKLNESEIVPEIGYPHGNMLINVPVGSHELEIVWKETPLRKFSNLISMLSITAAVAIISRRSRRSDVSNTIQP